jgi:hypothetical protein
MGAYGGGDSVSVGILDNVPSLPDRLVLLQNYPNPFNAQTTIRFVLPKSQDVLRCLRFPFRRLFRQAASRKRIEIG